MRYNTRQLQLHIHIQPTLECMQSHTNNTKKKTMEPPGQLPRWYAALISPLSQQRQEPQAWQQGAQKYQRSHRRRSAASR